MKVATVPRVRFGKSTHISKISNSVTHLWSYTNSAIAGNSARSPTSPRRAPTSRIERRCLRIERPPRDRRCRYPKRRRLHIECRYRCIKLRVFHNVLRVFHYVLLVVHNVLRCITMFHMCFMLFNNVLCLESRAMIGVAASAAADRLRDRR